MSDPKFILRFAIGDQRGMCSSVWRIWKAKKTDDIYVAPRNMAGIVKGSLHASGYCYFSLTTEHHAQMIAAGEVREKRGITRWKRATPAAGLASAFSVLFAAEFLSRNFTPIEEGVSLLAVPDRGHSVIVDLVFGRMPGGALMLRPNQHQIGRVTLSNGEVLLIIAGLVSDFDAEAFRRRHQPFSDTTEVGFSQAIPHADPDELRGAILLPSINDEGILRVAEIGPSFILPPGLHR